MNLSDLHLFTVNGKTIWRGYNVMLTPEKGKIQEENNFPLGSKHTVMAKWLPHYCTRLVQLSLSPGLCCRGLQSLTLAQALNNNTHFGIWLPWNQLSDEIWHFLTACLASQEIEYNTGRVPPAAEFQTLKWGLFHEALSGQDWAQGLCCQSGPPTTV